MMEEAMAHIIELGAVGCMLVIIIIYLFRLEKTHKEERKQWADRNDKHSDAFIEALQKNTEAITSLNSDIGSIKSNTDKCGKQ